MCVLSAPCTYASKNQLLIGCVRAHDCEPNNNAAVYAHSVCLCTAEYRFRFDKLLGQLGHTHTQPKHSHQDHGLDTLLVTTTRRWETHFHVLLGSDPLQVSVAFGDYM